MGNESKTFSTRDIGLASTLVTYNQPVVNITFQYEGSRRAPVGYFYFEETPELKRVEQDFWAGRANVEPKAFLLNLRSLKSQVTNREKNPDNR